MSCFILKIENGSAVDFSSHLLRVAVGLCGSASVAVIFLEDGLGYKNLLEGNASGI